MTSLSRLTFSLAQIEELRASLADAEIDDDQRQSIEDFIESLVSDASGAVDAAFDFRNRLSARIAANKTFVAEVAAPYLKENKSLEGQIKAIDAIFLRLRSMGLTGDTVYGASRKVVFSESLSVIPEDNAPADCFKQVPLPKTEILARYPQLENGEAVEGVRVERKTSIQFKSLSQRDRRKLWT